MITGINESKTLTKHISCECKCKFDGTKCNSNQWWYNDKCWCECKKHYIFEKDYVWNPSTCNCENRKYLASIINDSVILCNDIIDAKETNFNAKNVTCKNTKFLYFICPFINYHFIYLINIYLYFINIYYILLIIYIIAVSIHCYPIKYQAKQKHLLPFHDTKLKQVYIDNINQK